MVVQIEGLTSFMPHSKLVIIDREQCLNEFLYINKLTIGFENSIATIVLTLL